MSVLEPLRRYFVPENKKEIAKYSNLILYSHQNLSCPTLPSIYRLMKLFGNDLLHFKDNNESKIECLLTELIIFRYEVL